MKFIKFLALFCFLFITLNSCSTFSEAGKALRNEKTSSSDEFLIQKKDPLSQPPDYETIPEPGSVENLKKNERNDIEKILRNSKEQPGISKSESSSAEEFILNQIKK